ncbi:MAG: hypothetical protein ACE14V_01585 [bacterium]
MNLNHPKIIKELLLPIVIVIAVYVVLIAVYIHPYQYKLSSLVKFDVQEPNYRPELIPSGTVVFQGNGYDGQYNFYIIKDLWFRGTFTDAFRYQRVLYPILVDLLAFGNNNLIFVSFILINFISIIFGIIYLRKLIGQSCKSSWLILYGLNLGFVFGVLYDLGTPVAIGGIVISLYYLLKNRVGLTALFLAISMLTMENAVLVIVPLILYFLWKKEWQKSGILSISFIPWFVWQCILWNRFGIIPILASSGVITVPFYGIVQQIISIIQTQYTGLLAFLRQTNVVWILLFVVASMLISIYHFKRNKDLYSWLILFHAIFGICLSQTMIWTHTITSPARVLSGMFPLAILMYSQYQTDKWGKLLIYFIWLLTLLGILRIFMLPIHPYFIT